MAHPPRRSMGVMEAVDHSRKNRDAYRTLHWEFPLEELRAARG